jgi:methanogenic corrinoid protein MtbC1
MARDGFQTSISDTRGATAPLVRLLTGQSDAHDHELVHSLALEVLSRLDRKVTSSLEDVSAINVSDVTALCDALLSTEETRAAELVMQMVERKIDIDVLHLAYLGEAARMMGSRWEDDLASSAEVIIGAGRIYRILRQLRDRFLFARPLRPDDYRAVFASVPGEVHTLGITIAADYMRRRGWQVDLRSGMDHEALVDQIGHSDYSIIGLSGSTSAAIFPLTRLIVALRISNPRAWIVIGGTIVQAVPDIVTLVDADGAVRTVEEASAQFDAVMKRSHLVTQAKA